jgi:hypothetical protein
METYQNLAQADPGDPKVFAGAAWSGIQLGAWGSAKAPLAAARALDGGDPTYPALQGLAAWLDSTQYPVPKKGAPSEGYTDAISNALQLYSDVIELGNADMPRAYATRSLLYFSLRNSPRGETYRDEDYGTWMRLAIADADHALIAAEQAGLSEQQQVGYRYWLGRLKFSLALTWQEKSRGLHEWSELVPLYSSAYEDFSTAAATDFNPERRKIFRETWIPWGRLLLSNATHMQLARDAVAGGDFARAGAELQLVEPSPLLVRKWDALSAPLPDYHFLHGLISLGRGLPGDFPNPLVEAKDGAPIVSGAEASYDAAIAATENPTLVPQRRADYPDDARPALYQAAIADIDALLAHPPPRWPEQARMAAERVREKLVAKLGAVDNR